MVETTEANNNADNNNIYKVNSQNMPALPEEAGMNINMIAYDLLYNRNNTVELQHTNAILVSKNNDIMQHLQRAMAQLGAIQANNNPVPNKKTN